MIQEYAEWCRNDAGTCSVSPAVEQRLVRGDNLEFLGGAVNFRTVHSAHIFADYLRDYTYKIIRYNTGMWVDLKITAPN